MIYILDSNSRMAAALRMECQACSGIGDVMSRNIRFLGIE
jgi:hypothetical protein